MAEFLKEHVNAQLAWQEVGLSVSIPPFLRLSVRPDLGVFLEPDFWCASELLEFGGGRRVLAWLEQRREVPIVWLDDEEDMASSLSGLQRVR